MESANLSRHQHQHQEQFGGSSSLALSSLHGVLDSSSHLWNQNLMLNNGSLSSGVNGALLASRDLRQSHDLIVPPSLNISMFQDLSSHWGTHTENYSSHSAHELQHLKKIKNETPESFVSHLQDFPQPSASYMKHEQQQQYFQDLNEKFLLRNLSSSSSSEDLCPSLRSCSSLGNTRGCFSRIHPSATLSSSSPSSSSLLSSFGMSMQAMDLLSSAKFVGNNFDQSAISTNMTLLRESVPFGFENLQDPKLEISNSSQKISFVNGAADAKRANGFLDAKPSQVAAKKPRFDSRSSFPPFKVRKEKLGDRIAALQQLVAPFGKTDTASVLMEAIGYIKFLQEQVETLSVPYMKSSGNTNRGARPGGSGDEEEGEEPKRDLRSRGLCLVPLSCTSYVTSDSTASLWSPPNFTGGGVGGGN